MTNQKILSSITVEQNSRFESKNFKQSRKKLVLQMSKTIENAYLQTQQKGDIANGKVVIESSSAVYYIEYDTVTGPDGLNLIVVDNPGDEIRTEDNGMVEAPDYIIQAANDTLSNYFQEAKRGEGATQEGRVVFTGMVGFDDGWTP